jgi:hypothetical protein
VHYAPTQRRPERERKLVINLVWPTVLAFLISGVSSGARFVWLLIEDEKMEVASEKGMKLFLVLVSAQIVVYPVLTWAVWLLSPLVIESFRRPVPYRGRPRKQREKVRLVPMNGRRSQREHRSRGKPPFAGVGDWLREAGENLERKPPKRSNPRPSYAQTVPTVQAKRKPEVAKPKPKANGRDAFFDRLVGITHYMYPRKLTRDSFEEAFSDGSGTDRYNEFKAYWTRLDWVRLDGKLAMHWLYAESELYATSPDTARAATRVLGHLSEGGS